jgi:hypothetical protein
VSEWQVELSARSRALTFSDDRPFTLIMTFF